MRAKTIKIPKIKTNRQKRLALMREADRLFSLFIRQKAADHAGYVKCITCGRTMHWRNAQAGHCIVRTKLAVRYDERNVHPQCKHCNHFKEGDHFRYGTILDQLYGPGTAQSLIDIGNCRGKYPAPWFLDIIEETKKKLGEMKGVSA